MNYFVNRVILVVRVSVTSLHYIIKDFNCVVVLTFSFGTNFMTFFVHIQTNLVVFVFCLFGVLHLICEFHSFTAT